MRNTEVVSLSITKDLLREAEEMARQEKRSKSELIREALRQYMLRHRVASAQGLIAARARALGLTNEVIAEALVEQVRKASGQDGP